ncbi:MAG: hypothetical protein M3Y85_07025 [Bacteroidota bacterium]|nr:hypothetical protein [Bacteroidota bacterium]
MFELTAAYDAIYKWFDYLIDKKRSIIGYVIMPNHLHALISIPSSFKNLNAVISNGKRFLAYEIIKRRSAGG